MMQQIEEQCNLGVHAGIVIPPSWIIKLPRKVGIISYVTMVKRFKVVDLSLPLHIRHHGRVSVSNEQICKA